MYCVQYSGGLFEVEVDPEKHFFVATGGQQASLVLDQRLAGQSNPRIFCSREGGWLARHRTIEKVSPPHRLDIQAWAQSSVRRRIRW